jgi:hypothetical protein
MEPPPRLENPDRYRGDLDRQQHSTPLRGAWHESSVRGETMMLNPVGGEAGPLREGDDLILLSQTLPDLSRLQLRAAT